MSKAIIVVDWAYKGASRRGRGTGHAGLRSTLKYFQYRDTRSAHVRQAAGVERWHDLGLGRHYRAIFERCDQLQSQHVLAWTWVVSPAPDLMALIPKAQRPQVVCDLTERIVEGYYEARGYELPEYSYVVHERTTAQGEPHVHAHVVLAGTVSVDGERVAMYNNATKGHDRLFRAIATREWEAALAKRGIDWRQQREEPGVVRDGLDEIAGMG